MSEQKNNKSYTLSDFINIFLEFRKKILLNTLIIGVITAIIVFFILEPVFFSSGTIKTLSKSSGLGNLISSGLPDLGDLGDIGAGSSSSKDLALFENILLSRRCVEDAVIKFNIMDEYGYSTMYDAIKGFRENIMVVKKDKLAGTIDIGTFDTNPSKAKDMTEFLISQLNKINIEINVQDAKNNKEFIQSRYDLVQIDLKKYEDSLQNFQDIYGIAPDLKVQFASKVQFELEAEIKSEEIKLDLLKKILSSDQSEVKTQEEKLSALNKQLFEIQNSSESESSFNLKGSPKIVLDFYRIKRNLEIQNKIISTLIPLLEQAKIEENRNTPSVLVVDPPNIPDRKVKPKRLTLVAIFSMLTFIISYLFFLYKIKWNSFKLNLNLK